MKLKNIIPFLFIIILFSSAQPQTHDHLVLGNINGPSLYAISSNQFDINYIGSVTNGDIVSGSTKSEIGSQSTLGNYGFTVTVPDPHGVTNFTITPQKNGYRFEPPSINHSSSLVGNLIDQDFIAIDTMPTEVTLISPTEPTWIVNVQDSLRFQLDDNSSWVKQYSYYYSTDWTLLDTNWILIGTITPTGTGYAPYRADGNPSGNPYSYSIKRMAFTPTIISDYIIKFEAVDADDNIGKGYSGIFSVRDITDPSVTVTSPDSSETWYIDSLYDITWTATDNCNVITSRTIEFSSNNGSNWTVLNTAAGDTGTGTWSWIPNTPSTECLIRVSVYDQSGNYDIDTSDATFVIQEAPDITDPVVSVTDPTAGESVQRGSPYNVTWTASDHKGVEIITISVSYNGSPYSILETLQSNPGTWTWNVTSTEYLTSVLKITAYDLAGNSGEGTSGIFKIKDIDSVPPVLSVLEPVKGQSVNGGWNLRVKISASDNFDLAWVSYYLSTDNGNSYVFKDSIAYPVAQLPTTNNNIPTAYSTASDQCKMKVILYDAEGNYNIGYSDSLFRIIDFYPPTISITSLPNLKSGATHSIKWDSYDHVGISYVLLSLSTDNGSTFTRLDSISPDTGSYLWTVPQIGATDCFIKAQVFDAAGLTAKATTTVFSIEYVDIVSPTITVDLIQDVIQTDTEYEITWSASDNIGVSHVFILLSTDSGTTYNKLDSVSLIHGSYLWTTPSTNSPGCSFKLQVFDTTGNSGESESNLFDVLLPVGVKHISIPKKFGVRVTARSVIVGMEKTARVSIGIYTLNGRLLFSKNEILSAGYHMFPRISAHGIYILRIKRSDKSLVRKLY